MNTRIFDTLKSWLDSEYSTYLDIDLAEDNEGDCERPLWHVENKNERLQAQLVDYEIGLMFNFYLIQFMIHNRFKAL